MLRILGIGASPRRSSFNDVLLDSALDAAAAAGASTEKIILNELDFRPCQDCSGCSKTGICVLKDGLTPVYDKLASADAIIVASPIFFGSVTAQLKMFIDRLQAVWVARGGLKNILQPSAGRLGAFIATAGQNRPGHFENARSLVKILFLILGLSYHGELMLGDYDKKRGDAAWRKDAEMRASALGGSLAKSLQGAKR